jgi:branched-chain amino acid transport system substrate-binding protein
VSYEVTDPKVDSQVIQLKDSGADVFFNDAAPKAAAQAIRKVADLGWKLKHYLANVSASVASTLKPAGVKNSKDIVTAAYLKDPTDPQWESTPDFIEWKAWMGKYMPGANLSDASYVYAVSATMRHVLTQCGDLLTRENLMKQAASMKNLTVPLLLPGIKIPSRRCGSPASTARPGACSATCWRTRAASAARDFADWPIILI